MAGTPEFLATGIPALLTAIVMYILFCLCRNKFPEIYQPRTKKAMQGVEREAVPLTESYTGWLVALCSMRLEEVAQSAGVDAAARVAFQGTMLMAFLVLTVITCAALLPIYINAGGTMEDFERMTLANVGTAPSDDSMGKHHFAVTLVCWACSLGVYSVIYMGTKIVASLQLTERTRACAFWRQVVKVCDIPAGSRSVDAVKAYYEAVTPGEILYVQPIKDMGKKHEKLLGDYTKSWRALQHAEAVLKEKPEKRPMVKTGFAGLMGPKVDAIEHHTAKVAEAKDGLSSGISSYDSNDNWSAAFVTFTGQKAAKIAVWKSIQGPHWKATLASHPREIFWPNMVKGRKDMQQLLRCIVASLIAAFVIIIFAPLLALTISVCNLDDLSKQYAFLSWMSSIDPATRGLLQGLLPVIIVIVFNALVVPIMELLAAFSGVENYYDFNRRVMWYFFSHLTFNCFFVIAASSSIFGAMKEIIDNPSSIGKLLGATLPKESTFFILYVMASALGGAPGNLALIAKVVVSRIKLKYLAKTDFEKEEAVEPTFDEYKPGVNYAGDLFICVICLCYSFIAPLASVFGLLYFMLNIVTTKYLVTYYWKTTFSSSGKLSVNAFRGVLLGFTLGQLVVLLVIGLQGSGAASGCLVPLPIVSFIYAVSIENWGPGKIIQWSVADTEIKEVTEKEAESMNKKLLDMKALWTQPSVCPNFDDPVHNRFNWRASSGDQAKDDSVAANGDVQGNGDAEGNPDP